jgi:hypothetical protein
VHLKHSLCKFKIECHVLRFLLLNDALKVLFKKKSQTIHNENGFFLFVSLCTENRVQKEMIKGFEINHKSYR